MDIAITMIAFLSTHVCNTNIVGVQLDANEILVRADLTRCAGSALHLIV